MKYKEFKAAVNYLQAKKGQYPSLNDLLEFIQRMS
jgi:hypothetical protein